MNLYKNYKGFLFIGDPHLVSKNPKNRLDTSFCDTILNKLDYSFNFAKENNLYPVILGDLFDDDKDEDSLMLVKLVRILKKEAEAPVTIVGNHEKKENVLTDNTSLALLRETGLIKTIEKNGIWGKFIIDGTTYYLGGTPYGQKIPPHAKTSYVKEGEKIIWITHHDLVFKNSYPGAVPAPEIKDCILAINGHNHKYSPPIKVGETTWHNPGNITRMSKDTQETHTPKVWMWLPSQGTELVGIEVPHQKEVFNFIGNEIKATEKDTTKKDVKNISSFVQLLKEDDIIKSNEVMINDEDYIKDNILALSKAMNLPEEFTKELDILIAEVTEENKRN